MEHNLNSFKKTSKKAAKAAFFEFHFIAGGEPPLKFELCSLDFLLLLYIR